VNVVASADHLLGEMLATDPRVDVVTFTGSTATGRRVMASAAATVKKVFLELGGKSATIMLDDADLPATLAQHRRRVRATRAGMRASRPLLSAALALRGGRRDRDARPSALPLRRSDEPRASPWAADQRAAARARARLHREGEAGGRAARVRRRLRRSTLPKGYYVEPTLFVDVDPKSTLAQRRCSARARRHPFEDDDDAVRIANDSIYGLSGAVASASEERALAVARRIRTGTLGVNGAMWFAVDTPFGGYRQSGVGRENGVAGLRGVLETKVIGLPPR
jgi:aldehyde dehydrogenase (NAD+)